MRRLLKLIPEYRAAMDEVSRLRGEMLAMRSRAEVAEAERDEAVTRMLDDRTRMVDFLAKRGMGETVFANEPAQVKSEQRADTPSRVVAIKARSLTGPIPIYQLKQQVADKRRGPTVD